MIHFDPLETSKEVNVSSNDDELGEGNELIILELVTDVASNVINVNSEQQTTNITIVENDSEFLACATYFLFSCTYT